MENVEQIKNILEKIFWDMNPGEKNRNINIILSDKKSVLSDKRILIKLLTGLAWYDLQKLFTQEELKSALNYDVIDKLFPVSLRNYYNDAAKLLRKYSLPSAG